ncbi:MAG: hypothetical protein K2K16_10040, partial [Ruminococcus sp.]|nr:hypothetical protein [Ruminococcus sp.]
IKYYKIDYSVKNIENKNEEIITKNSYMVFDPITHESTYKDIFFFLADLSSDNLQEFIRQHLENNKLPEDYELDWKSGLKQIGIETLKYAVSYIPYIGKDIETAIGMFDSEKSVIEAFGLLNDNTRKNAEINRNIDEDIYNLCGDYASYIKLSYSYVILNGYSTSDIIVKLNEYGLVTNIDVSHNAIKNENFSFSDEWNQFLIYCKNNNTDLYNKYINLPEENTINFNSLDEEVKLNMAYYYYRYNNIN